MGKPEVEIQIGKTGVDTSVKIGGVDVTPCLRRIIIDCHPVQPTRVFFELSPFVAVVSVAKGIEALQAYLGPVPEDTPEGALELLDITSSETRRKLGLPYEK